MSQVDSRPERPLLYPDWLQALRPVLLAQSEPVFLVGGIVRDIVRGAEGHDLDLAVARRGMRTAYKLGNALEAPAYALDKARDVGRVVLPGTTIDVARFRGETLVDDLMDRDFTINAMALPAAAEQASELVDPSGGLADLQNGIIRQVAPTALTSDPVRALRALRLALQLNFAIEPVTWASIAAARPLLPDVSPERLRDELVTALLLPEPAAFLEQLALAGLASHLLPPLADTTAALLTNLARLEAACDGADATALGLPAETMALLAAHWARPVDGGYSGRLPLRLAALLSHLAPAQAEKWLRDYRFSNEVCRHVRLVVAEQGRLLALLPAGSPDRRQIYRYFKGVAAAGLDIAALTVARQLPGEAGSANPADSLFSLAATLAHHYQHHFSDTIAPTPLLRGDEIMQAFALQPGPLVGELLARLEEEQAAGELKTKKEALVFLSASLNS
ncbi:MAG: CCA tRNA nucleotidyltransferase [Anaerolineales bacterium]|nr:CCA tRNA nucleotidyltransferase [Anaerolineales bacterium]